jgi:hypothetical protein
VALGGFLLGAALLSTGTANADQVAGGGRQVVFAGGGVLGLSCKSTPSVESMTVPADWTVRVVNRTGHVAKLLLNGTSKGSLPDNGSTEVVFRHGTTAVILDPSCAVTDQAMPVLITATPSMPAEPDPIPAPSDSDSSGTTATPADSGTPTASDGGGSSLPDSVPPATQPQRPSTTSVGRPATAQPDTSRANTVAAVAATTAVQAMPQGGSPIQIKTRSSGTAEAVAPAFSGMPPGDDKAILPGVPTLDPPLTMTEAAPAVPAAPPSEIVAAEPVAAMEPLSASRPIGLLALIASVCVVGVAVGAIRAIVSQRASRASVA